MYRLRFRPTTPAGMEKEIVRLGGATWALVHERKHQTIKVTVWSEKLDLQEAKEIVNLCVPFGVTARVVRLSWWRRLIISIGRSMIIAATGNTGHWR